MHRIHVLTGGPYHPVAQQVERWRQWLAPDHVFHEHSGVALFEHLDACDLVIIAGLHWTGCRPDWHVWPTGVTPHHFTPLSSRHIEAFGAYVASGRPVLGFHGGIASYDDTPEFARLLGWRWDWRVSSHTRYASWPVDILATGHPCVAGVQNFTVPDELYFNLQVAEGLPFQVHARSIGLDHNHPMLMTAEGGRVAGAGKTAYIANGHDLASFENQQFRQLVVNTIRWILT